jgi:predicted ATPase
VKTPRKGLPRKVEPPVLPRVFIQGLRIDHVVAEGASSYALKIPAIQKTERLNLHPRVTFFIGENGSGKSTLLEAIAVKMGYNAEGGGRNFDFATRETHSDLHRFMTLERGPAHPTDGFFLRAESFYNLASQVDDLGVSGYGKKTLHAQSHGESFLALLANRLRGDGVYLFDEPEVALSPQRQLSVLTLLHRLVHHRSQLIIATHSPILLAYPDAVIYEFSERGIHPVHYTATEHFQITKDFLNRHERMLDILLGEEDRDLFSKRR